MQIVDQGIIFKSPKNSSHKSHTFPGICILPSGRWLASCRRAPTKKEMHCQHPLLSFSDNEGKSWSEPYNPFNEVKVNEKPGLYMTVFLTSLEGNKVAAVLSWVDNSKLGRPFFNPDTEGLLDTRIFIAFSEDGGLNWNTPRKVDTDPFEMCTPLTGPLLKFEDGTLACQFELNKSYYDTKPWRHSPILMFSTDNGTTWPRYTITGKDAQNNIFYWDQRPSILSNKSMLNLFWTYDTRKQEYLNIHATESFDNGHKWSVPWDTGLPGQPAKPLLLPDGKVAMICIDRSDIPEIKLRLSSDSCKTWLPEELVLYRHEKNQNTTKSTMKETWSEMNAFAVGLPAAAILPNGQILVVYYAGNTSDETDIFWVRIKC